MSESGAAAQDVTVGRTYLAQPISNAIFVLASGSMELLHILRVPASPAGLVVDARHHLLYVAADNAGVISVYDDRTYRLTRRYGVGGHPAGLVLAGRGQQLLMTDDVDGSLRALGLSGSYHPPTQLFTLGPSPLPEALLAPRSAWSGGEALAWGQGFTPGEPLTLSWGVQPIAHDVANAVGIAMVRFRVPRKTDLGDHLVILQGSRSSKSESGLLGVVPAPPAPPSARHHKRAMTRSKTSLLQMVLGPSVTVPLALPLPGSHPAATARGTRTPYKKGTPRPAASGLRVPLVLLPVILLFIALALFKMGRGRRRAKARAKTSKGAPAKGKGGAARTARSTAPLA
ncbi:MAG: hypothetical protein LC769_03430 [Chloroflexi bacterium]|nr:hypothetical protein [Chloroflexota bacterium]